MIPAGDLERVKNPHAQALGRLGGLAKKGKRTSRLAIWLEAEIRRRRREDGWQTCRQCFSALADSERPINADYFRLTPSTADQHCIETASDEDEDVVVTFRNFRRIWQETRCGHRCAKGDSKGG